MNGRLSLSTAFDGQKTVTEDLYFAPPFKVYSPFYDHKGWAKYISMCGSAGVWSGDGNENKAFSWEETCKASFTDQGYQKLFNTNRRRIQTEHKACCAQKRKALLYAPPY